MISWIKNLFRIVREYDGNFNRVVQFVEATRKEVDNATHYIKKATKIHVDIAATPAKLETTVILCGRYRGKDHVQVFSLRPGDMPNLIDQLKHMQRAGEVVTIDAMHGLDATIKRELKR